MSVLDKIETIKLNSVKVYETGESTGYETGKAEGYNAGYEKGKAEAEPAGDSHYDTFWDMYQENGNRTDYSSAFEKRWTNDTFKPKYDIVATSAKSLFYDSPLEGDLVEHLNGLGVSLDLSRATTADSAFRNTKLTRIGVVDLTGITSYDYGTSYLFYYAGELETIDKLIMKKEVRFWSSFYNNKSLKNITFEGVIGRNFELTRCPALTKESLLSAINVLEDKTTDTSGTTYTVTLGSTNLSKLTDEEIAVATEKGWTVV